VQADELWSFVGIEGAHQEAEEAHGPEPGRRLYLRRPGAGL
jgi:hypothetical protein